MLLDGDNVGARYASDVRPEAFDLAPSRKPRKPREWSRDFQSGGGIALAELHRIIQVRVWTEAVKRHRRHGAIESVDVDFQRLAGRIPVLIDRAQTGKFQFGIPEFPYGDERGGLHLVLCAASFIQIFCVASATSYPATWHDALRNEMKRPRPECRGRTTDQLFSKVIRERTVAFPLIPIRGSDYRRAASRGTGGRHRGRLALPAPMPDSSGKAATLRVRFHEHLAISGSNY